MTPEDILNRPHADMDFAYTSRGSVDITLTKFPSLTSTQPTDSGLKPLQKSVCLPDFRIPREVLILSWAYLLHCYTEEQEPVFLVDEGVVRVDLLSSNVDRLGPLEAHAYDRRATRICFGRSTPTSYRFSLELLYRPRENQCILRGSSTFSDDTLNDILHQLKEISKKGPDYNELSRHWTSDLSLSILNPHPQILSDVEFLHQLLIKHSSEDATALDHLGPGGKRHLYSYKTVDQLSSKLASRLQRILTKSRATHKAKSHIIPILVPQTPELYIALIAILKAGAAFCPLNTDAPKERVKFVAHDVDADLIITTTSNESRVSWDQGPEIFLLDDLNCLDSVQGTPIVPSVTRDGLAYMMYTSGSTGKPKGVGISHKAACQAILAHQEHLPTFDRFLQFAAPTFDVFVFEVFFTLFRGSTIVSCNRGVMLSDLPGIINRLDVDAVELTPTVLTGLLRTRTSVPRLRLLLTIGEKLSNPIVKEFGGTTQHEGILHGMYGPTEATIHCTSNSKMQSNCDAGIIGVPLATVSSFIIEPHPTASPSPANFIVLPVGHIGELAIGGHQLANGYHNRPEQTAQSFFDTKRYGRVYRTGDKARQLPGGDLEYLGRLTSGQVKLRGQRLELGEVENALCSARGVTNAIVAIIDDVLVAFCLIESENVLRQDILNKCRLWLPAYMVPGDLVLLQEAPRLASGKVDKKKLESEYRSSSKAVVSDQTSLADGIEKDIAQVARELLGNRYGSSTSLAAAGLDSLTAIRFTSRLQDLGLTVGAVDVLSADSVKEITNIARRNQLLAAQVCGNDDTHCSDDYTSIKDFAMGEIRIIADPADVADIIRCTPIQIAMLAETAVNSQAYCNWMEVELPAGVSHFDVEAAFRHMAYTNEILRSGFVFIEGSAVTYAQIIWNDLSSSQFDAVSEFNHPFTLDNKQSLLRPLRVSTACVDSRLHLLVQIHHALCDGWTWEHILNDLELMLSGQSLPPRPQYRRIVNYFFGLSKLASKDLSLDYWTKQLDGFSSNPLPNYHGRNDVEPSLRVIKRNLRVAMPELETASRGISVAPLAFFQFALAYLLGSYLGSPDIVFGTVTSGRTLPVSGIEHIMGPCIATLPTRVKLRPSQTVRDAVQSVHKTNRESLEHSAISLREIKGRRGLESSRSLFDALMVWQQTTRSAWDTTRSVTEVDKADFLECNLTLEIEPGRECITIRANYQQAVFPQAQVDLILEQIDQLVECMITSTANSLDEIGQCFTERSLSIQNLQFQHRSNHETLISSVERIAVEDPQRVAVEFARSIVGEKVDLETLSYKRLNQRANQLAQFIREQQISGTDLVCIYMEKSIVFYVSVLATIKAGLGYLPLTPETPQERFQRILTEASIKVCLTTSDVRGTMGDMKNITYLDVDNLDCSLHADTNPGLTYNGSDLAYAVFTSGSTGAPKGVLVTYQNLLSNLTVLKAVYPVSSASRFLQSCSQAFDVSVFEIFFTWYSGICLCSATKDVLFRDIENAIRVLKVTHLSLTPTVAAIVDPTHVPAVEFLVTAGEGVTSKVFNKWAGKGLFQGVYPCDVISTGVDLGKGYGPSEVTNICTVKARVQTVDAMNNIGPPLKNTSAFVASDAERFTILPRGAFGELCFGGDQVCRGYLNMPALTASKFLNHPRYGRIYRSGDYGRLLSDGSLSILGRKDDQVKIRGQRVELGEINSRLLQTALVNDCTTLVLKTPQIESGQMVSFWIPTNEFQAAYSILSADESILKITRKIFRYLNSSLPSYMIPFALVPVTCLPSTSQSKIDNSKLATSFQCLSNEDRYLFSGKDEHNEEQQDFSDHEYEVARVLTTVVKVPLAEVRRHTSFYSLGLDSISAIALSRALGIAGYGEVGVSRILRSSTVASLSQHISVDRSAPSTAMDESGSRKYFNDQYQSQLKQSLELGGKRVESILPSTPLQEAMLSTLDAASSAYYNHLVLRVFGHIVRLKDCWEDVVSRHGILRTCFKITAHHRYAYAQVVLMQHQPSWEVVEATPERLDGVIREQIERKPGSIQESEPPYAFTVVTTPESSVLILSMHHALYDGSAMSKILEEVELAYRKQPLPPVISFDKFLGYMDALDLEEADRFWSEHLQQFEPTPFPNLTGKSLSFRSALTGTSSTHCTSTMPLRQVEDACKRLAISLHSLSQSAWARLLSIYLGENDICFGNVVSGRTMPLKDIDKIVGPCFNTLPVRVRLDEKMTNVTLMEILQHINADSLPFQLTPLRRIQSKQSKEKKRLFDTLFILQQPTRQLDEHIWSLVEDLGAMDFPIVCEVVPNQNYNSLEYNLHYHRSLLSQPDADLILRTLDLTLQSCLNYSSGSVADYSTLSSDVLSLVNRDPAIRGPPPQKLFHSGFEENVRLRPEAPALDFLHFDGGRTIWSFEHLNQISNQIARVLLKYEVQHDQAIPICMPKSPYFYASLLAVLKAGAAFTPVDPQAPSDRKQYMLDELQAELLITSHAVDVSWTDARTLNIDDPNTLKDLSRDNICINRPSSANLAYRMYTSGSTGRPKAVSMEHRGALQTIEESKPILPWTYSTRLLQYAATTFDMCYYDCFLAWNFGFALCAAPQSTLLDDLTMAINTLDITMLDLTPTVASTLAKESIPKVEFLYCIGEPMPQQLADTWTEKCVNSYGPTEAAMCCTIHPMNRDIRSAVIGTPFPSTSFSARAEGGEFIIPRLGIGELYIGGAQIARGYHANPELTQASFINTKDGQRLYKSGDIVRMLSNGHFEYLGRRDDQVKIRGLRVELAEINNVIKEAHPLIGDVSTQVLKYSSKSQEQLVAFLGVPNLADSAKGAEVKEEARLKAEKTLPSYMIPQIYITLHGLPRSTAGKVEKRALLEIFIRSQANNLENTRDSRSVQSWTQKEKTILRVFSNLSGIDERSIGHNMTIYELGFDSISAGQVAAQLRTEGIAISTGDVIEHPTIRQLAILSARTDRPQVPERSKFDFAAFDKKHRTAVCDSLMVRSEDIQVIRPCTPVQAGMVAQFLHSGGDVYFNSLTMRLAQDANISTLKDAWDAVKAKYQMLRTGFANVNDVDHPFAMLTYHGNAAGLPWSESYTPLLKPSATVKQEIRASTDAHRLLHLPSWRLLLEENLGIRYLHLSALHALYDAQVLQMILADVASLYHGRRTSIETPIEPTIGMILDGSRSDNVTDMEFWRTYGTETYINRFPNLAPLVESSKTTRVLARTCSYTQSHLQDTCRQRGVTVQAAGQAAWSRILSAYTGDVKPAPSTEIDSQLTMAVFSGRNKLASAERVAFPCITTLPMSCKVQGSNDGLIQQIMSNTTALMRRQFTPLAKIQRMLGHPNEALFDSIFAYQKLMASGDESNLWEEVYEETTVDYAISIELVPTKEDHLRLRITFTEDSLPQAQADLLLRQLDAALLNTVSDPEADCSDTSKFNRELLSISPPKEPTLPAKVQFLHQFVEVKARQCPDRVALEFATSVHDTHVIKKKWSYHKLNTEGNTVAHLLMSRGIVTGDLIAICFDKCPEASFAILGILKAGCAYVALDPAAPVARRTFILRDSQAKLLIGMKKQTDALQEHTQLPMLALDDAFDVEFSPSRMPVLTNAFIPSNTCYCLYTSGTTGTPKGCEITHENVVQAILAFQRLFKGHWDDRSRWLQFASFHFDVSVLEQYWSWSVGICVTSAPRDLIFEDIAGTIQKLGITHIDLTPSLASTLHPDDVPSLCRGVFITGGEQLKQEIIDVWGPKGVIFNGYGPTEATIGCTMFPRVPQNGKPSNIGPQFDNVGTYVLRPDSSVPVLRGAVGELCISGSLVSRGYLHRPKLTEEKFPVLTQFVERVYRTGDLVRILHNNTFDFLGRTDDQVKLRGQRLEIGEINIVVKSASSDIQDCVTLVLQHPEQLKEQLVSFLVSKVRGSAKCSSPVQSTPESQILVALARDKCRARLPSYMVPTHFVLLTSIPLSANNKADAKLLTAMYGRMTLEELRGLESGHGDNLGTDWSDEERRIAEVLSRRLGLPCKLDQRRSSFFELGLDSITVIPFANSLREAGFPGAQISVVMSNPTIYKLAKVLSKSDGQEVAMDSSLQVAQQRIARFALEHTNSILDELQMSREAVESIVPCTPLQEGMFYRSLASDEPIYFGAFLFEIKPSVELARLKSAWARVIANTQVLRTRFVMTPEGQAQIATRGLEIPWSEMHVVVGSEEQNAHDRYEQWSSGSNNAAARPFELVIIRSWAKSIMCVHMFHAVYDGTSLPLVMNRLGMEYAKPHSVDYGPAFHDALPYGPLRQVEGAEAFWTEHLSQSLCRRMPPLIITPLPHNSAATLVVSDIEDLERLRRSMDATHQALVQACWIAVLQKYFAASVTLGLVVSGRSIDIEKAELTIGPLFNTIPFHVALDESESWRSLVSKCQEYNTAALPFQHTPLRDIKRWCKRSPADPLFDTLFVFQRYPLAFEAEQQLDKTLKITVVAQGDIASTESSLQLLESVKSNIFQMLADPDSPITNPADVVPQTINDHVEKAVQPAAASGKTIGVAKPFRWSIEACSIRDEIASLANVDKDFIGEHTSIFELGLDSIDAINLCSRLKRRGIDLPVSMIMKLLTVAGMTDHLSLSSTSSERKENRIDLVDFKRSIQDHLQKRRGYMKGIEDILPVTPLQEALVAEMINSDYTRYFNHDVLKIMPSADIRRLHHAWRTVVKHSAILRTSFAEVDDPEITSTYAQIIHKQSKVGWRNVSVNSLDGMQEVFDHIRQQAARKADSDPPFKLTMVSCRDDMYLIVSIAHALYDGWSLRLLHEDLRRAYNGLHIARPSYREVLANIVSTSGPVAATYWKNAISGARSQLFPKRGIPNQPLIPVVHRMERISSARAEETRSFCKAQGITMQTLGQTSWACMLAHYLETLDVVFGSILSGRDTEEANDILFPAMTTVAIRSILRGTRKEMLRHMQALNAELIPHQHFPLRKIQAMTETPSQKLFDSLFIYQKRPEQQLSDETQLYQSIGSSSEVDYPVCVEMEQVNDCLIWRTACHNSVLSNNDTAKMLNNLDSVMLSIAKFPDADVLDSKDQEISICNLLTFRHRDDVLTGYSPPKDLPIESSLSKEWSPTEITIRSVLSHMSKTPENDIYPDMTIFRLGLDSINAIKVSSLLRKRSIKLSVSDMLQAATIRKMASVVDDRPRSEVPPAIDSEAVLGQALERFDALESLKSSQIDVDNLERVLPASAGQTYMLSVWQNSRGALFYPVFEYSLQGPLPKELLEEAWRTLIGEFPILRTTFVATEDYSAPLVQAVFRHVDNPVVWLPPNDTKVLLERRKTDFKSSPVTVYAQQATTETRLKLQIHHALYDGVSLPELICRLEELCNHVRFRDVVAPSYADFLALEYSPTVKGQGKKFWASYLPRTGTHLPSVAATEPLRRVEVFRHNVLGIVDRLERFARRQGLSVQMLFLAAFSKMHARIVKITDSVNLAQDTVFGIYLANRSYHLEGLSKLAAPTINLVPLRVKAPTTLPIVEIAQNIQQDLQLIGRIENSSVALWEVEKWTGITIDCFVNFLKLPNHEEEQNRKEGNNDRVVFEEVQEGWDDGVHRLDVPEHNGYVEPGPLAKNIVKGSYLPSLDVEATIKDGFLNIGIFCPENLLGLREADHLINEISKTLEAVMDSNDDWN
ncbi:MAG: hypothetical protein M1836_007213 [Candelina mexicana]|nr:MAG: hypothetical protein M1836_007213 [Candelina mexicana]